MKSFSSSAFAIGIRLMCGEISDAISNLIAANKPITFEGVRRHTYGELKAMMGMPYYNPRQISKWFRRFYHALLILNNRAIAIQLNKEEMPR